MAYAELWPAGKFGYKDFIPLFQAKDFNADDLAQLIKESGAKYFAPTVEHHDGFSLWNSATNPFNAYNMGHTATWWARWP